MSAADVIKRLGRPIVRRRFANGTWTDGYYTEDNAPTDSDAIGSVQPLGYKELQLLPEGERSKQWIKIYTVTEFRTADEDAGHKADQVIVGGKTYEIQRVADWTLPAGGSNLTHYEVHAVGVNAKTNVNTNTEENP